MTVDGFAAAMPTFLRPTRGDCSCSDRQENEALTDSANEALGTPVGRDRCIGCLPSPGHAAHGLHHNPIR
jgi:hypothetical protein